MTRRGSQTALAAGAQHALHSVRPNIYPGAPQVKKKWTSQAIASLILYQGSEAKKLVHLNLTSKFGPC